MSQTHLFIQVFVHYEPQKPSMQYGLPKNHAICASPPLAFDKKKKKDYSNILRAV